MTRRYSGDRRCPKTCVTVFPGTICDVFMSINRYIENYTQIKYYYIISKIMNSFAKFKSMLKNNGLTISNHGTIHDKDRVFGYRTDGKCRFFDEGRSGPKMKLRSVLSIKFTDGTVELTADFSLRRPISTNGIISMTSTDYVDKEIIDIMHYRGRTLSPSASY